MFIKVSENRICNKKSGKLFKTIDKKIKDTHAAKAISFFKRKKYRFSDRGNISKLHILIISQYFYPENFRINDIAMEWIKRGYRVTVLTGIPNYPKGKFFDGYSYWHRRIEYWNGVKIIRIPILPRGNSSAGIVGNYLSFVVSGWWWKKTTNIHADLVFTFEVSPMTQALIGCWYSKKYYIPHFLYVQDLWPENIKTVVGIKNGAVIKLLNKMVDYIYKNTDRIFAASPAFVNVIVNRKIRVPKDKVYYWPQYAEEFYQILDRRDIRSKVERQSAIHMIPDDNGFNIAFTGNIGTAQGLDILPKTAARLKYTDIHKAVRFIIIGNGRYQEELKAEIKRKNVTDSFIMIPQQPPENIPKLLACCDAAFLSFSNHKLWEWTIPAKLQSYMACGKPIIASANGETARIIKEADCGLCCKPGDSKELAETIALVLSKNQEELDRMGTNGRVYCESHYNKVKLMDKMDDQIINKRNINSKSLLLKGDTFIYNGKKFKLDDLFTSETFEYADKNVDRFNSNNIFDNALYFIFILNIIAIEFFLMKNGIEQILFEDPDILLKSYLMDAGKHIGVDVKEQSRNTKILLLNPRFINRGIYFYLLFQQICIRKRKRRINYRKDICIIRTTAAKKKIKSKDDREFFYEDKIAKGSLYNYFSIKERLQCLNSAVNKADRMLGVLDKVLKNWNLTNTYYFIMKYASLRFLPVCFYGSVFDKLLDEPWKGRFISGNNLDMYACIEEDIALKHNMQTICIPHGAEFGYKYPHGYTGSIFYATSETVANHLNRLYNTEKFIFDKNIVKSMFEVECKTTKKLRRLVYFSEAKDFDANILILKGLIEYLKDTGIIIYVKLHPKDSRDRYKTIIDNIIFIDDFEDSICNNICIARKSTTLIEGIYNDSICAAILINEKDKSIYQTQPSLQDHRIKVFYSIASLSRWIIDIFSNESKTAFT